jgi:hypothetical protein
VVGKDGQAHTKEVDATSLFDAADEVIRDWNRLWWWSSSSPIRCDFVIVQLRVFVLPDRFNHRSNPLAGLVTVPCILKGGIRMSVSGEVCPMSVQSGVNIFG